MAYSPWKQLERRHAKRMGGERLWRPDYGEVAPDGETDRDVWDCKAYASHAAVTLFVQAVEKYKDFAGGRRFHLCLFSRKHQRAGDFVVLRAADFAELLQKEKLLDEFVESFLHHELGTAASSDGSGDDGPIQERDSES